MTIEVLVNLYQDFLIHHTNLMIKQYTFLILGLLIITITSCEKILFGDDSHLTNKAIFERIWQFTNDNYCCFETAEVDWDEVYELYAPQVDDSMDESTFLTLMDEMLQSLKDSGLSLVDKFGSRRYDNCPSCPTNYNPDVVSLYNPDDVPSLMIDSTLYVNTALADLSCSLFCGNSNVTGVIFDMRKKVKPDGILFKIACSNCLAGAYFSDVKLGKVKSRFRDIFGSESESLASFCRECLCGCELTYEDTIAVLIDNDVIGYENTLAYYFSYIPNVIFIGDTTGGGNMHVRIFLLSNGWVLEVPTLTFFDVDDNTIYGGFEPDIFVDDDPATTDKDEIIEAALDLFD